jgi:hypothetical protein
VFISLFVIGGLLLCAGALVKLNNKHAEKPENLGRINLYRRSTLGVAFGFLAALSTIANGFVGPTIRNSLPDPRLLSYLASQSVAPGDPIISHTQSPDGQYTSELVRLSAEDRVVFRSKSILGVTRPIVGRSSYLTGAMWAPDVSPQLFAPAEPGIYSHRVSDRTSRFDSVFCVRPRDGQASEIALLLNTNTWAAYNDWGVRVSMATSMVRT